MASDWIRPLATENERAIADPEGFQRMTVPLRLHEDQASIRSYEEDHHDFTVVAGQGRRQAAGLRVPGPDRPIIAGGGKGPAVGGECHPVDLARVRAEDSSGRAGLAVPEPHGRVLAGGGDGLPVGGERRAIEFALMPPERRPTRLAEAMQVVPGEAPRVVLAGPGSIPLEQGQRLRGPIVATSSRPTCLTSRARGIAHDAQVPALRSAASRSFRGRLAAQARSPATRAADTTMTPRRITAAMRGRSHRGGGGRGRQVRSARSRRDAPRIGRPSLATAPGRRRRPRPRDTVGPGRARGTSGRSFPGRGRRPDGSCSAPSAARLGPGPGSRGRPVQCMAAGWPAGSRGSRPGRGRRSPWSRPPVCPPACSGAMNEGVPRTIPVRVRSLSPSRRRARPKSATRGSPRSSIRMFDGLRSRWRIPRS